MKKETQVDIDDDSAMGFSVVTGGKSTTLSEASVFQPHSTIICIVVATYPFSFAQ